MTSHAVVSHEEWNEARIAFLAREKEFTRLRDQLSQARRDLPWESVDKEYVFEGAGGRRTLSELFDDRSQLIVYHFMFDPGWDAGCPHCSFWADNFDRIIAHLEHRDVTMIAVSRAPLAKLEAYRERMGWTFTWVSAAGTDFNADFGVRSAVKRFPWVRPSTTTRRRHPVERTGKAQASSPETRTVACSTRTRRTREASTC